ncbi:MAG: transglutaminase-like domain-containing protein [Planctomycetota bacterium]|jgi:regulator of sirC expression with transglutaminase-like and TPR domain
MPSSTTVLAVIDLLGDDNPKIARTCRNRLLAWGESAREFLIDATSNTDAVIRLRARAVLRALDQRDWRNAVRKFAASIPSAGQIDWRTLERGAVLLSSMDRMREVQANKMAATLDQHAAELQRRIAGKSTLTIARLLSGYLAGRQGYGGSGNSCGSFYDATNVTLDTVVEHRLGVPVSLSLLYMLVGRRVGLHVAGVAIPDHFLVRVHGTRPVLLDPYHEGRSVTKADCVRYLRRAGYGLHTSSYLEDVSDRQVLAHLVRNLSRVYGYREDNDSCTVLESARQALVGS